MLQFHSTVLSMYYPYSQTVSCSASLTAYVTFETAQGTKVKYAAKKIELEMDWGRDYMLVQYMYSSTPRLHQPWIALTIYVGSECAESE